MFNILNSFDCSYNKIAVWNCRFCTNLSRGCEKCAIEKSEHSIWQCRSFDYYVYNKIKCECLGKGCRYCKYQGFIVERIHNYKNHDDTCNSDSEYYSGFNDLYTIIDEEDWNHFKCLNVFFIPPSEKERLMENYLSHQNFKNIFKNAMMKAFSNPEVLKRLKDIVTNNK